MAVTCIDVMLRKFGVMGFPYTKAQEMEWHLHTAIFSFWLGFNYAVNAHPRVDSYTDRRASAQGLDRVRRLPGLRPALHRRAVWYGWDLVRTAWVFNERSDSALGLPYRWIIKGILLPGFWLLLLGVVSVLLRLIVYLFGQQEVKLNIGSFGRGRTQI